jgi:hypothetical protein
VDLEKHRVELTTDPDRHSGQGIFFTSRMLDGLSILSHGAYFSHAATQTRDLTLENNANRRLKDVFDKPGCTEGDRCRRPGRERELPIGGRRFSK